jgi:uncharacterized membrane protein
MKQSKFNNNRSYDLWKKLMRLGEYTGCHQLPERSFFIHSYQFPICARCTGVLIGYILSIPCFFIQGFFYQLAFISILIMFLDWSIQYLKILQSTNLRRLITGILGGYGIMSIQLFIITQILLLFYS